MENDFEISEGMGLRNLEPIKDEVEGGDDAGEDKDQPGQRGS